MKVSQPAMSHRDRTPTVAARKSDLAAHNDSTESTGGGAEKQPKLKYAAFAHIDLSSFDFQKKQHNSSSLSHKINEHPFQEKSRSVIAAIPKSCIEIKSTRHG